MFKDYLRIKIYYCLLWEETFFKQRLNNRLKTFQTKENDRLKEKKREGKLSRFYCPQTFKKNWYVIRELSWSCRTIKGKYFSARA